MMKSIFKGFFIAFFGLVLIFSLSACAAEEEQVQGTQKPEATQESAAVPSTQESKSEQKAETLRLGAVFPLTGDGATYGEPMQKVIKIAVDEINAGNGVNGKKLEFIWENGKCNGNDAAAAVNKLINIDKVQVIYGGFCSSETLAAAPIAEKAGVIVFSPGSSSPVITTAGDYIFRNYPSDASQGKVLAEAAKEKGFNKVAVLAEQNDYTQGILKVFESRFKELGGSVVVQTFLPYDSDFRTPLLKLKSSGASALFIDPQTPNKADLIFKQLEEMKWKVALMANDVVAGYQDLITKYAKNIEGLLTAEFSYDKENPNFKKLAAKYKELAGSDLPYGSYATTVYDGVYVLKEAIEAVGYDASKIKTYLYAVKNRKGLAGSLTFDSNGDPVSGHILEIVKDGKVVPYAVAEKVPVKK